MLRVFRSSSDEASDRKKTELQTVSHCGFCTGHSNMRLCRGWGGRGGLVLLFLSTSPAESSYFKMPVLFYLKLHDATQQSPVN